MSEEKLEKYWNKVYYDYLEQEEAKELIDYYKNMEQENKQLKEEIERQSKAQCILDDEITELQKENELLQYDLDNANSKLRDYVSKCLKVIEYIKKHKRKDGFLNLNEWQTADLLKILGSDKENE